MNRRRRGLRAWLLLAVLCGSAAQRIWARGAPELALKDIEGHTQKLSALRGKVVVLSFWATWCGPCREELPRLSKLSQSYRDKPVAFVAVSIDGAKDRAKIAPFLAQQGVHLAVWQGADTDTMARLGLGVIVPSTVILDERGEIVTRIEGEAREEDVANSVDWLLSGRSGTAPATHVKRY